MPNLTEAPHIVYNDKNFGTIDFQVEKMPIPKDEKIKIAKSFNMGKGIIGKMPNTGKLLQFSRDGVKVLRSVPKGGTMLPKDWNKYAVIMRDNRRNEMKTEENFREILRSMIKEVISEKWEQDVKIKSTGEHAGKSINQLKKEIESLKGRPGNKEKMGELLFALRAKQGWKKGKGATGLSKGE